MDPLEPVKVRIGDTSLKGDVPGPTLQYFDLPKPLDLNRASTEPTPKRAYEDLHASEEATEAEIEEDINALTGYDELTLQGLLAPGYGQLPEGLAAYPTDAFATIPPPPLEGMDLMRGTTWPQDPYLHAAYGGMPWHPGGLYGEGFGAPPPTPGSTSSAPGSGLGVPAPPPEPPVLDMVGVHAGLPDWSAQPPPLDPALGIFPDAQPNVRGDGTSTEAAEGSQGAPPSTRTRPPATAPPPPPPAPPGLGDGPPPGLGLGDPADAPLQAPKPLPSLLRASSAPVPKSVGGILDEEPPPQKPQTLVISPSEEAPGVQKVCWTVDAKKLKGSDKVAVSPSFELAKVPGNFKIMLVPKAVSDRKGGASFKKAKGRGYVQLKCEAALEGEFAAGPLTLRASVGTGNPQDEQEPPRGPVSHNFAECGVCCLSNMKQQEEWNFSKAVDEASQTFEVCLELLPQEPVNAN